MERASAGKNVRVTQNAASKNVGIILLMVGKELNAENSGEPH